MLRRSFWLLDIAPPVIMGRKKTPKSLVDGNPSESVRRGSDRSETFNPLEVSFGTKVGDIPKFHARNAHHRQIISRRIATELVRSDHAIVPGAKGPALRILGDHIVELAKRGDTDSRQKLAYYLQDPLLVDKAFDEYPRRFKDMSGKYCMMTKLRIKRRTDTASMYFVEFKNRDLSDTHKGEDYSAGPERFFLPSRVIESEKGVQRPPHLQMAFDRWASKFKTEEFTHWWRLRHAKMRFWGIRNVPHPMDVDPLWSEKEEEEWHNDMMSSSGDLDDVELDLDDDAHTIKGEGGR